MQLGDFVADILQAGRAVQVRQVIKICIVACQCALQLVTTDCHPLQIAFAVMVSHKAIQLQRTFGVYLIVQGGCCILTGLTAQLDDLLAHLNNTVIKVDRLDSGDLDAIHQLIDQFNGRLAVQLC